MLRRGMLMTSPARKSCLCPLSRLQRRRHGAGENPPNPARICVQDHGQRQAEIPAGAAGRKLVQEGGKGGEGGVERRLAAHRLLLIETQLQPVILKSSLRDPQR